MPQRRAGPSGTKEVSKSMGNDSTKHPDRPVYVMNLRLVCGGYAYVSILTNWVRFCYPARDVRKAATYREDAVIGQLLSLTRRRPFLVQSREAFATWLTYLGWAVIPQDYARNTMAHWLKHRSCLRTAFGSFVTLRSRRRGRRCVSLGPQLGEDLNIVTATYAPSAAVRQRIVT